MSSYIPKKRVYSAAAVTVGCCLVMAAAETFLSLPYFVKSRVKIAVFLGIPALSSVFLKINPFKSLFSPGKKATLAGIAAGLFVALVITGGYFLTKNIFDYRLLVFSLSRDQQVGRYGFRPVALYICFCNSLLEEFLFRCFSFFGLMEAGGDKKAACLFGRVAFSAYHVAMLAPSFPPRLLALCLLGLFLGGVIFNILDLWGRSAFPSWAVHFFADRAVMLIWRLNM